MPRIEMIIALSEDECRVTERNKARTSEGSKKSAMKLAAYAFMGANT
jgi:hypothetical protein